MIFFNTMRLLFLATMIWAIYSNITFMKKWRAKRNYKGATLSITEEVVPEWKIEPSSWVVAIILDIGRALLGISIIFLLFIRSKSDSIILHPKDFLTFFTVLFLCFPAVSVAGYLFGSTIVRTIQNYFSKVRNEALSEQGILYGEKIIAWEHFRGYLVSSDGRYIYLMSKYYPTAISFSFAPTSNEDFDLVLGEIKKHLPNCEFASYNQEVGIFMNVYFQSVLLSIILMLLGLIGLTMALEIGIILNSLLMYLHVLISLRIVNRIIPTGKFPVAEVE